jgi:polyhydroxyalkanoate synthase
MTPRLFAVTLRFENERMPMADAPEPPNPSDPRHWAAVIDSAQTMIRDGFAAPVGLPTIPGFTDPATLGRVRDLWLDGLTAWQRMLLPTDAPPTAQAERDKRFKADAWHDDPVFAAIRRSYGLVADHVLASIDALEGLDPATRERLRFGARGWIEAMSPSNFAATNPEVIAKTIETRGENLLKGLANLLGDLARGQMTHVAPGAFELGRNLATTPGKVIHRTRLYELIQYAPATDAVLATPLVIFPPWINRFYILDLTPEKSFIRWAVGQGLTVFMVSWKSADADMADVAWDDYVAAQREAIDVVRDLLGVSAVHAIGYCVAGTTLAATLAVQAACGEADNVASATFFTAQVDFADAGELKLLVDDSLIALTERLSPDGFLDGRFMAATFNALRGQDLIWNYVTSNYLLGNDYPAFDLLHWNGDITNLPGAWHRSYLADLYRDNRLVEPGALSVSGVAIDLTRVATPTYVQAGRDDHIAPAVSVFKLTRHFRGPVTFVLAGSGHIAGVVNPPAAGKYQYWTNPDPVDSLDAFLMGATETKGSWWPHWIGWLHDRDGTTVPATGARVPGSGARAALADAPGDYVRTR